MQLEHGNPRFFASTRGKIVVLLRRASHTVEELAQALDLTDNAVRAHLATLERDGLVQQRGRRRGSSKPAYLYDLTVQAERLFPKAYSYVLQQLLDVLGEHMRPEQVEVLMRTVGHRIAEQWNIRSGKLDERLEVAVEVLNELGGLAELEEQERTYVIQGYSCPLAAVVPGHPEICRLAETLLTELAGVPVQQQCNGSETGHCCFIATRPS
ncbi:MAG: ArsR family transcriptional regulator [Ktedonobacteraceae bacterium]|nr:ArsR family transcriptional regulator [Ktedonobacteraceae bacterium]